MLTSVALVPRPNCRGFVLTIFERNGRGFTHAVIFLVCFFTLISASGAGQCFLSPTSRRLICLSSPSRRKERAPARSRAATFG